MRLAVTRPEPDANAVARLLTQKGHTPLVAPLMHVRWHPEALPDLRGIQALLFTSGNGVRAFVKVTEERLPVALCVGAATAKLAEQAGFFTVLQAGGDVQSLRDLVLQAAAPDAGPLLHVAGTHQAGDLAAMLTPLGFQLNRVVLYEAHAAEQLPSILTDALAKQALDGVLLYSPRSARLLLQLMQQAGVAQQAAGLVCFCLSPAVAEAANKVSWAAVKVARAPTQSALLEEIESHGRN